MNGSFEDKLRETMRAHDRLAPTMTSFRFRAPAPMQGVRVRRAVLAASIATAGVVGSAVIVLLVRSDRGTHPDTAPQPAAPSTVTQTMSSTPTTACPSRADTPKEGYLLPGPAVGVDTKASLVPASVPQQVTVCAYQAQDKGKLTGRRTLDGRLDRFASDLHWLPPRPHNTACAAYLSALDGEYYLIHASYPSGSLWIAAPGQHCDGASNGAFETANLSNQARTAYATGTWQPAQPVTSNGCRAGSGRLGQQHQLVPDTPNSITVCEGSRTVTGSQADAVQLANAMNRLAATSTQSSFSCANGAPTRTLTLTFGYTDGPPVALTVMQGCAPDLTNGNLDAQQTNTIKTIINNIQTGR